MNNAKKILLILFILLGCLLNSGVYSQCNAQDTNVFSKNLRLAKVQDDFNQLKMTINSYHPMIFTDKEELNDLFTKQYQKLTDKMSLIEFYRIIEPIISKIHCGHTYLELSDENRNFIVNQCKGFPIFLKFINERAYVYQNFSDQKIPVRAEVVEINHQPMKTIISTIFDNVRADGTNQTFKYNLLNRIDYYFNYLFFMLIDTSKEFNITYINPVDNKSYSTILSAVPFKELTSEIQVSDIGLATIPLKSACFSEINKDYAMLSIKTFSYRTEEFEFKDYIDDFFKTIRNQKVSNLILDLRNNIGGSTTTGSHLYSYLIHETSPYFAGRSEQWIPPIKPAKNNFNGNLYVLVNGGSFSQSGFLCSLLKYNKLGLLVGEETGGSFLCSGPPFRKIVLNHCKIVITCPSFRSGTAVTGLPFGRGVTPDYIITPTIEDYFGGNDRQLEYVVKLIKSGYSTNSK